jgi:hypothetical protein
MTTPLPYSQISVDNLNTELQRTAGSTLTFDDLALRTLTGITGLQTTISMLDMSNKSGRNQVIKTFSANAINQTVNVSLLPGYKVGLTDITIVVNANITISTNGGIPAALVITGVAAGDRVTLINNGIIWGMGGNAAYAFSSTLRREATAGMPAISLGSNITIANYGIIAGGGGGGGGWYYNGVLLGGGGGGTATAQTGHVFYNATLLQGGFSSGGNIGTLGDMRVATGGAGGAVLPGGQGGLGATTSSTMTASGGGGAGGGGGAMSPTTGANANAVSTGGRGGDSGQRGFDGSGYAAGGGGGGHGAAGGNGGMLNMTSGISLGGAGGAAVLTNGYTITWAATGTRFGSYT